MFLTVILFSGSLMISSYIALHLRRHLLLKLFSGSTYFPLTFLLSFSFFYSPFCFHCSDDFEIIGIRALRRSFLLLALNFPVGLKTSQR